MATVSATEWTEVPSKAHGTIVDGSIVANDSLAPSSLAPSSFVANTMTRDALAQDVLVREGFAHDGLAVEGHAHDGLVREGFATESRRTTLAEAARAEGEYEHSDLSVREKTVAVAEAPARGAVVAEARVQTRAGEIFADAADEKRRALDAGAAKAAYCAEASAANPSGHAAAAISDIGTKFSAKRDERKASSALDLHERTAASEERRAHDEAIQSKEKARLDALREAEAKASLTNRSTIVSEYATPHEIVVVAEVAARGATFGTGVAESHADDHLVRASKERVLAAEAAAAKEDASARLAAAHPFGEAKASVGGIGTKIHAKMHEAKEWFGEKRHGRHAEKKEHVAESTLQRDTELAREKALSAAQNEAARLDSAAHAEIIDEHTTRTVTSNATSMYTSTATHA